MGEVADCRTEAGSVQEEAGTFCIVAPEERTCSENKKTKTQINGSVSKGHSSQMKALTMAVLKKYE